MNNEIKLYDDKYLEFITDLKDKQMLSTIGEFMSKHRQRTTEIQIKSFLLNDVEFPTAYGKWQQAKVELGARYHNIVDIYFELKELDVKIRKAQRKLENETDEFEKELIEIQIEKLRLRYSSELNRLKTSIDEAKVFYEVYNTYPQFHNMTEEEEKQYEAEQWGRKALNMPFIFHERYGPEVLKMMWGEDMFKKYEELLEKNHMMLPRDAVLKTLGINNFTATLNPFNETKPELVDKEKLKELNDVTVKGNIINDPVLLGKI